jgi:hypothetical protein
MENKQISHSQNKFKIQSRLRATENRCITPKWKKVEIKKSDLLLRVHDLAYKYKITCLGKSEVIERNLRNWHFK